MKIKSRLSYNKIPQIHMGAAHCVLGDLVVFVTDQRLARRVSLVVGRQHRTRRQGFALFDESRIWWCNAALIDDQTCYVRTCAVPVTEVRPVHYSAAEKKLMQDNVHAGAIGK